MLDSIIRYFIVCILFVDAFHNDNDKKRAKVELIKKHFPKLSPIQNDQYDQLWALYKNWNEKINVISRKDIDNLYINHVLHSLTIAKFIQFKKGTKILDLGTGGGFPAIPLAIFFPEAHFTAIDGTRKKITVVQEIIESVGLTNITTMQKRAEEHKGKYEFVVSRAVAKIAKLKEWTSHLIDIDNQRHTIPNGIIALKGGALKDEVKELSKRDYFEKINLQKLISEPDYEEKYLLYLQR